MDEVGMVMSVELLADLERRTGVSGPFAQDYERDRAVCKAIMNWLRGVGDGSKEHCMDKIADPDCSISGDAWARLRLLLNYVHERGYRLGSERAMDAIRDQVWGSAVHRSGYAYWSQETCGVLRGGRAGEPTLADLYKEHGGKDED